MASRNDIARETNTRFWLTTFYKPGVALSNLDSADKFMARRWLEIYRDLVRQNADGVLSLTHKHPSLSERLNAAIDAYRVEASTNERDPRYTEARAAKAQALNEAALWEDMLTSPSRERIVGGEAIVGAADTQAAIDQLHAKIMQFGQAVSAHTSAETARIKQLPSYHALHYQVSEAYNRAEMLPPGSWERFGAVSRYRTLQERLAKEYNQLERASPILVWARDRWEPFRTGWLQLRDGLLERERGWGREYVAMVPTIWALLNQLRTTAPF